MLPALVMLLHKLWDKGVDIAAAVIASTLSAGIVATIATVTWRWNKRRDLKHEEEKQRQQQRIAAEHDEEQQRKAAHERLKTTQFLWVTKHRPKSGGLGLGEIPLRAAKPQGGFLSAHSRELPPPRDRKVTPA